MTAEQLNLILAGAAVAALIVLALTALLALLSLRRMTRDVSSLTRSLDQVVAALNEELPPALKDMRATSANLARLTEEAQPRIERVDVLLDEADLTLKSLRATVEEAESIVRGPAAAVDRAKRMAGSAGRTLASGADRIRRGVEDRMGGS